MTETRTDRGDYVTDQVALWISNDGAHFERAQKAARHSPELLAEVLTAILRYARRPSAAWHVAQELAPNDYTRVYWSAVVEQLLGE